jgi:hypothetical protein
MTISNLAGFMVVGFQFKTSYPRKKNTLGKDSQNIHNLFKRI